MSYCRFSKRRLIKRLIFWLMRRAHITQVNTSYNFVDYDGKRQTLTAETYQRLADAARNLVECIRELEGGVPDSALVRGVYGDAISRVLAALPRKEG